MLKYPLSNPITEIVKKNNRSVLDEMRNALIGKYYISSLAGR
jgi:hypothetical protein